MPSDAKARRAADKKKKAQTRKQGLISGADGGSNSEASSLNGDSTPGTPILMSANSSASKFKFLLFYIYSFYLDDRFRVRDTHTHT